MKHETLDVWQRVYQLSVALYLHAQSLGDVRIRDQFTRSGLSLPSNILEVYERESDKELARFLTIAKGSAAEQRTQLFIGVRAKI